MGGLLNSPRALTKEALRAAARRLPRPVRHRAARLVHWGTMWVGSDSPRTDLVSAVVAVTDTEIDFLDEALESLRVQTYPRLQILVAPFGSCHEVIEAARRHAAEDWRVHFPPDVGARLDPRPQK